jgi:hypothetical protein
VDQFVAYLMENSLAWFPSGLAVVVPSMAFPVPTHELLPFDLGFSSTQEFELENHKIFHPVLFLYFSLT